MTGNASTHAVGTEASGRSEPKSPTPMGGASVSEVLAAAADLLEKPGAWTQGAMARVGLISVGPLDTRQGQPTCRCAEAAIIWTHYHRTLKQGWPGLGRCLDALRSIIGTRFVTAWNDAPERTQAEVVDALRQAARQASIPTAEGV